MTLAEQLTEDMKASMKAGEADRTGVLRLLRSSLKNEEIKQGGQLNDDAVLKVLAREAKQRRDSIEAYTQANRDDLKKQEEAELVIIAEYLPKAMSDEELVTIVDAVIAEVGATTPAQMGAVIGRVMVQVGTRAEGGAVSRLVRDRLAS